MTSPACCRGRAGAARRCGAAAALCLAALAAPALEILCTTFPVYQFTRTVTQGRAGVRVELMLPAGMGCPHDYALTPQDLQKLAAADVVVANGLGLEEFLQAALARVNPDAIVLDTAAGIDGLLPGAEDEAGHGHRPAPPAAAPGAPVAPAAGHPNPHLFASPRLAALVVTNIAAGLARLDPAGAETFGTNSAACVTRLQALARAFAELGPRLANRRVALQHDALAYLARDAGLEVIATLQEHGQAPSAAAMLALARKLRAQQVAAVLYEPQYAPDVAQTLAREAGAKAVQLDPVASGPDNAPPDYYENAMRRNLRTLAAALGGP